MTAEAIDAPPVAPRRPVVLRHRVRGKVLVLLCVLYAISYVDRVNISTAAPYIRSDLGLSSAQLGLVLSAFSIPYAFLQVAGGWLGDRLGARRTLARLLGRSTPLSAQEETELVERLGSYRGLLYFLGLAWSRGMVSAG